MASRPLMCTERIKSSTTVEAIGSNPAVGSSYMTSCSQNQYSKIKVQYTWVCLPLTRSLPLQVNQLTEVIQSEWGHWPYHPEFNQPCLRTTHPDLHSEWWPYDNGTSCSVCPGLSLEMIARASATLFFMPPESSEGNRSSTPCLRFKISFLAQTDLVSMQGLQQGASFLGVLINQIKTVSPGKQTTVRWELSLSICLKVFFLFRSDKWSC
jgi:hypothetical protein